MILTKKAREKAIKQLKRIEKLTDGSMLLAADWREPWKVLISTMLSAQTKDETTIRVSHLLYNKYPTLKKLANADINDIMKIIKPVNFYKTKAKHILKTAKIIVEKYNSKVPKEFDKLLELPGVGRKTANVFLAVSGKPAIGVDTHVSYISRLLGWTKENNPHKIEQDLKELFPQKYWILVNYALVRFGRTFKTRKKQEEVLRNERIIK
ncbi:MAG: endonuclease III [Candidatus Pacearchaeota archaeon]